MTITNFPLISIIVPIYNSEDTLEDCLRSLSNQTYTNIEVILINDGSTDKSYIIAETYCKIDRRFKLFDQCNSGVAAARQKGLDNANGEYIIHCDSDDIMLEIAIEDLFSSIDKNQSDIAVGSYIKKMPSNIDPDVIFEYKSVDANDFIRKIITGEYHAGLCNKLIRATLCKKLSFAPGINFTEDKLYLIQLLLMEGVKISIVSRPVYIYNHNVDSYTNNISIKSVLDNIEVTNRLTLLLQDKIDNRTISHLKNKSQAFVLRYSDLKPNKLDVESVLALKDDNLLSKKQKLLIYLDYFGFFYIANKAKKTYRLIQSINYSK